MKLSEVKGIGKKKAKDLEEAGIKNVSDLVDANPKELAEKVSSSEKTIKKYQKNAKKVGGDKKEGKKSKKGKGKDKKSKGKKSGKGKDKEKGKDEDKKGEGESKEDEKGEKKEVKHPKKSKAIVNGKDINMSTKHAIALCRFIKGKLVDKAVSELKEVIKKERAVPMKGEIGHKKGMSGGRYPVKASKAFVRLLNQLRSNSEVNGITIPRITIAKANKASRPYRRFGSKRMKRSHVYIEAKENSGKGEK